MKTESSPGFMTQINSKLIEKRTYVEELSEILQNIVVDDNETCVKQWQDKASTSGNELESKIPKFHVEQSSCKWGKLKTNVLRINCAEEDAQYLKYLLSTASANGAVKKDSSFLREST